MLKITSFGRCDAVSFRIEFMWFRRVVLPSSSGVISTNRGFLSMAQHSLAGQGRLIVEIYRSHSIVLLWASD
jgi:hypothetical protein